VVEGSQDIWMRATRVAGITVPYFIGVLLGGFVNFQGMQEALFAVTKESFIVRAQRQVVEDCRGGKDAVAGISVKGRGQQDRGGGDLRCDFDDPWRWGGHSHAEPFLEISIEMQAFAAHGIGHFIKQKRADEPIVFFGGCAKCGQHIDLSCQESALQPNEGVRIEQDATT